LLVHYARHRTVKRLATNHRPRPWLVPLVKILGGLALILFAVGLFFTVVPISANGDFIAAGC
ncbi:nickel transporter, partial [Klebsiella pneumoniae]